MRTEALFFKTLFLVFLSFYIVSYFIFLILAISTDMGEYTTTNFITSMKMKVSLPFLLGFIATIFFSPVLLFISFVQWWMRSKTLKNTISFILMILYGYMIFFVGFTDGYDKNNFIIQYEIIHFLIVSIPSTLLFIALLSYLIKRQRS